MESYWSIIVSTILKFFFILLMLIFITFSVYEIWGGGGVLTWTGLLAPESFAVELSVSLHLVSSLQSNKRTINQSFNTTKQSCFKLKLFVDTCTAAAVSSARFWLMVGLLLKKPTIWSIESFKYCQNRKSNHERVEKMHAE
jgi:hypothetical protein